MWGAFWSWEPVQILSVLAWLLYAVLLQTRCGGWRGRRAATLTIVGFALLIVSFRQSEPRADAREGVRMMQPEVLIVGLNHRTAAVDVRERVAFADEHLDAVTRHAALDERRRRGGALWCPPATGSRWSACGARRRRGGRGASPRSCAGETGVHGTALAAAVHATRSRRRAAPLPRRLEPRFDGGRRAADPRPAQGALRAGRQRRRHRCACCTAGSTRRSRSPSACAARPASPAAPCRSASAAVELAATSSTTSRTRPRC